MRQYRSNQGRSPQKEKETMKLMATALVLLVIASVIGIIVSLV
mgnify:CR=1 FL=1